jgi:hypothetical protein
VSKAQSNPRNGPLGAYSCAALAIRIIDFSLPK